jgi:tetratricopeptide (TPR) repeat protein
MSFLKPRFSNFVFILVVLSVLFSSEWILSEESSEKASSDIPTSIDLLANDIKQAVKALGYPDAVGNDLMKLVSEWNCIGWKERLGKTKQDYQHKKISENQLTNVELEVIKELGQMIQKEIKRSDKHFYLPKVIKEKQANCLGYTQLFYILGNSIGLNVKVLGVLELDKGDLKPEERHIACLVELANGRSKIVSIAGLVSKSFVFRENYIKVGEYWEKSDINDPLEIYRKIQILNRNGLISIIYSNLGNVYNDSGNHSEAISCYDKAIELDPKDAVAYYNRGRVYAQLGQNKKLIDDCTKAIEINPKFASAYYNRGITYTELGQYVKAVSDHSKAIELDPNEVKAYVGRGTAYGRSGKFTEALSNFNKAIELNPKDVAIYHNRGLAFFMLGKTNEALIDYDKVIELDPEYIDVYYSRGGLYYNSGKFNEAIADYSKAIELDSKNADTYFNRGVAHANLGETDEAKRDLQKAVELNPAFKERVKELSGQLKLGM